MTEQTFHINEMNHKSFSFCQGVEMYVHSIWTDHSWIVLGNERDAHTETRLKELGITHVLNCTSHLPFHFAESGVQYKRLPANDSCHQNLSQFFSDAFDYIGEHLNVIGKKKNIKIDNCLEPYHWEEC